MTADILIPKRSRGRPTAAAELAYQEQVEEFCCSVKEIRARLDFDVSRAPSGRPCYAARVVSPSQPWQVTPPVSLKKLARSSANASSFRLP
jgi:hypothetical protein